MTVTMCDLVFRGLSQEGVTRSRDFQRHSIKSTELQLDKATYPGHSLVRFHYVVVNSGTSEDRGQSHGDYLRGSQTSLRVKGQRSGNTQKCRVPVSRGDHAWMETMVGRARIEVAPD